MMQNALQSARSGKKLCSWGQAAGKREVLHLGPVRAKPQILRAFSSSTAAGADKASAKKAKLESMSGSKQGLDMSPEEKKAVVNVAQELADLKRIDSLDMSGSKWKLVFSESTASSGGKIGPFTGRVEQTFPANQPGQYINWCYLGPLTLSLLANYKYLTSEKIEVTFEYIQVEAGFFKWKKELKNSGIWDSLYIDNDFRILRANQKNLFVLRRIGSA